MRSIVRSLMRCDPSTGVLLFALWALIEGASLLPPAGAFATAKNSISLRALQFPQDAWGVVMLVDGAALLLCVFLKVALLRVLVGVISACFWALFGYYMILGGYRSGDVSPSGIFAMAGAVSCMFALPQWAAQEFVYVSR